MTDLILDLERQLYSNGRVADKHDILERMRFEFDRLYREDRAVYNECREALQPNTWEALEELWTFWNRLPKNDVDWEGPNQLTCVLRPSHPGYAECTKIGFTKCQYDEIEGPDFSEVTFRDSVVDISDLYDSLTTKKIEKRGGSANSLQEIAQMRMAERLKPVIEEWARENNREPDFWAWRDAHDLLPHEDPNCRTMRLVSRPVHGAFLHRGGVANAKTIKRHFG